ncbi:MAG: ribosomal RNA small subunit methyltransferase A [Anaerolineaceae bacterium]|nr:ribosomal RNA small subunit methyltransferase A [Anaerolineaceae bacterium]
MNLSPLNISALLRSYGLTPRKSLGQNFLVDPTALERIIQAAEIPPGSTILEVGPGLGSLTRYLALVANRVVAVELDGALIPPLEHVLNGLPNVEIVHADILKIAPGDFIFEDNYLVVANIPYYITSNLIRHLLEAPQKPNRIVLTVQREVAERITATPNDMNLLALSVQVYGSPKISMRIPAGAFYPPPTVDSSVVRIDLYPQPIISPTQLDIFFRLAKAGFGQKRKTLRNSLSAGLSWPGERTAQLLLKAGIDPQRRAETLGLQEWKTLVELYAAEEG